VTPDREANVTRLALDSRSVDTSWSVGEPDRTMPASDAVPSDYARLQGVGRALAVLEALAGGPLRPVELTRALDMKWTTAYRTLTYLTRMGYVERDEADGTYSLGVRAYALGSAYLQSDPLLEASRPYLDAAASATGATVQLIRRDHRRSVVLSVFEGRRDHVPDTAVGCNFPLHCGSKGHVLLAHADPAFVEDYLDGPLERLTPRTLVDPVRLRERFARVRAEGHATTDGDVRLYSASVAAPIFDRSGCAVAAVTIIVRPDELRTGHQRLVTLVTRMATGIGRSLRRAEAGDVTAGAELQARLTERYGAAQHSIPA
jgi:DNA-binding IclR family transcriptional regulator